VPVNGVLGDPPTVLPAAGGSVRRMVAGLLLPAAAIALAVFGFRVSAPGGVTSLDAVTAGLIIAWALCTALSAQARERTPQWQLAAGAVAASAAFGAARVADEVSSDHHLALGIATVAGLLVIAISVHLLLALPDGRLGSRVRRFGAVLGYAAAVAVGAALAAAGRGLPAVAGAVAWSLAFLCALPAVRLRYNTVTGRDKERLQWAGIGVVLAGSAALSAAVLYLLIGWPAPLAPVAAGATVLIPLGLLAGDIPQLGQYGGRLLVQVLAIAGFVVTVAVIYLVIVLGLGKQPSDAGDRELLGLSMVAAAVAAISFAPARERLLDWANRRVFGARHAPDELLRTFGSRMTRAISMDELLLQLAESLRKTMRLTSAEVYTGTEDVLERVASVPDAGPRSIVVGARERPIVARAGVSGRAWASVWLPALLDGRGPGQLRLAPVGHSGELLGLIVAERPPADVFSEEDDRVLTELAREVGLAVHNARLDTALQTTLDELRKQADELRGSRARIVASGDAERRRVERNLHDGAQQHLVAMAVNLRLARDSLADDPSAAVEMLDQLAEDVKDTIQELRELAHGIYPPLLADSGLGEALSSAARRSPQPVRLCADGIRRYALEIESAVYFCCLEALQNAAKHAPGAQVEVRLWEESGGLLFSVVDDGPGFDAEHARGGHGFVNMADRLGAIGGTVRWESQPGEGARILGSVPLLGGTPELRATASLSPG
jgi:signal transduction histidine kinase